MLKKAEFVHADLEYHEELLDDAKGEFSTAINEAVNEMTAEDKKEFLRLKEELIQKRWAEIEERRQAEIEESEAPEIEKTNSNTELVESEDEYVVADVEPQRDLPEVKAETIKKLFYKIAAKTHPDKFASSDLAPEEIKRIEKIFKKAKSAYENGNWYGLYVISLDLNIEVEDIGDNHVEWIEDDIRHTLGRIAQIAQLAAWAWYTADEKERRNILRNHFSYTYGFKWKPSNKESID